MYVKELKLDSFIKTQAHWGLGWPSHFVLPSEDGTAEGTVDSTQDGTAVGRAECTALVQERIQQMVQ